PQSERQLLRFRHASAVGGVDDDVGFHGVSFVGVWCGGHQEGGQDKEGTWPPTCCSPSSPVGLVEKGRSGRAEFPSFAGRTTARVVQDGTFKGFDFEAEGG